MRTSDLLALAAILAILAHLPLACAGSGPSEILDPDTMRSVMLRDMPADDGPDVVVSEEPASFRLRTQRNAHPRLGEPLRLYVPGGTAERYWLWASEPIVPVDLGLPTRLLALPTIQITSEDGTWDLTFSTLGWYAVQVVAWADGQWTLSDGLYLRAGR